MVSTYLDLPCRTEAQALAARDPEACLAEAIKCMDRAAAMVGAAAERVRITHPDVHRELATLASQLGDPEDALWHDHVRPAQEMLREVYGE